MRRFCKTIFFWLVWKNQGLSIFKGHRPGLRPWKMFSWSPAISQCNSPFNEFTSAWSMFVYNLYTTLFKTFQMWGVQWLWPWLPTIQPKTSVTLFVVIYQCSFKWKKYTCLYNGKFNDNPVFVCLTGDSLATAGDGKFEKSDTLISQSWLKTMDTFWLPTSCK